MAVFARAGDYLRFYEINPQVEQVAAAWFTYLTNCPATVEIATGDARLSLEHEPPQNFDLLVLDAFNSDAVPVHLLTREAFAVYRRHLRPGGVIAINISNHHLNLKPVVANLARHFHCQWISIDYEETDEEWWLYSSTWALMSDDGKVINAPAVRNAASSPCDPVTPSPIPLWTDDFVSLFQILY
jgi:spermidine synthase